MLLIEPSMSLFQCRCNNKSLCIIVVGSRQIKSSLKMQSYVGGFFCLCISNACCHCYLGIVVIRFNQFSDLLTQGDIGTFNLLVWLGQKCICYRYDDCLQMILCWK